MPVLQLKGCHYEPLGDYLKALGIFRLVAEQLDPAARCWWKDGIFHLYLNPDAYYPLDGCSCCRLRDQTTETEQQKWLEEWFLSVCKFSPFVLPWHTRTQFFSQNGLAAQVIVPDTAQLGRMSKVVVDLAAVFAQPVDTAQEWFDSDREAIKMKDNDLIRMIRNSVRDPAIVTFCDALASYRKEATAAGNPTWQPFMGKSGAAESSGQFGATLLKALQLAFQTPGRKVRYGVEQAIADENTRCQSNEFSIGIFWPAQKDDPNLAQSPKGGTVGNPWNVILLFEALPVLAGSLSRKHSARKSVPTFPFFTESSLGGNPMLSSADDRQGTSACKGELWLPLWNSPASGADIQSLFSEGRIGPHGTRLHRGRDFVHALGKFGALRGIEAFSRFGVFERSGSGSQTTFITAPLGIHGPHADGELTLLAYLESFSLEIDAKVDSKSVKSKDRIFTAGHHYLDTYFDAHQLPPDNAHEHRSRSFHMLIAASRFEREMEITEGNLESDKPAIKDFCLPSLTSQWLWVTSTDDKNTPFHQNTTQFRLARAIGTIEAWPNPSDAETKDHLPSVGPLRENLSRVIPAGGYGKSKYWRWEWPKDGKKANRCVWRHGLPFLVNCAAVLKRRMMDADPKPNSPLPLWSGFGASLSDVLALWRGEVEESELTDIAFAFSLIRQVTIAENFQSRQENDCALQINATLNAFEDDDGIVHSTLHLPKRGGEDAIYESDWKAANELPRAYALLKLCFMGGRLPPLPFAKDCRERTGNEPHPPGNLAILNLLLAGRLTESLALAARRLRARGYPTIWNPHGSNPVETLSLQECIRLAGLLLIPTFQTGALASLVIKPKQP
jgi:CRISPR-associated protein Csx17